MTFIKSDLKIKELKNNHLELALFYHNKILNNVNDNDLRFIDLFAGIGGFRISLEKIGAKCVFSSEINPHAQLTYFCNHGSIPFGDINSINTTFIPDHDILCAGFPCQPFSLIGKREGFEHPTQGRMFHEIIRIVIDKNPKVLFLENVTGIINHNNGKTLNELLEILKSIGYHSYYKILNASDYGVPQHRKRFYLIAFNSDKYYFTFPNPVKRNIDVGRIVEENINGYSISHHLQKNYLFKKDDRFPRLIDINTKGAMNTLSASYHKIQRLTGTFVKDGETGIRLLSVNECKKAMSFPINFKFPVARSHMYAQMGNSVAVKVVTKIAKQIKISLENA